MIKTKKFTYNNEEYSATLSKNYKQRGWFVVIKYPLLLRVDSHWTHNKVYKMEVSTNETSNIDAHIEYWKKFKHKELWENAK